MTGCVRTCEWSTLLLQSRLTRKERVRQKSEDNLSMAEQELDKQTLLITELTRKVDELQVLADDALRLKDQVDEFVAPLHPFLSLTSPRYRHAAEKLQKTENVMEKYKKKLQEGADLRQHVKALEKQNADLVDQNASLEEEYRKVAGFKPLMESYKNQILELETKNSAKSKEIDALKFEVQQMQTQLRITQAERAKDSESLELYQERVRELELLNAGARPVTTKSDDNETDEDVSGDGDEDTPVSAVEDETHTHGLGGELDDAISGTTMTDLKLQIRKLERELKAVRKNEADASRVLVYENLLEDANKMKARYESDYLTAHREKLLLQRDLEEIRSGKSLGDGYVLKSTH